MVAKIINATEARVGTNIILDGNFFTVKKMDVSKTGKHGHAKCRVEAANMSTGAKKVFVVPGHDRFEVPVVNKNKAQVLSMNDNHVSVMDLESFETIEIEKPADFEDKLSENDTVEYWNVEGTLLLKRKL